VDAPDLTAPFRGARATFVVDSTAARCRAYLVVAPNTFAFSHATAALLYGIPLPRRLEASPVLHVSVPDGAAQPRRRGTIGHRGLETIVHQNGLPLVRPEVAWLQLAAVLTVDELVVAGDFLVRKKRPLSTLVRLAAAVEDAAGQRGVERARSALREVRTLTESPRESWLRLTIVRGGLPEPVVGFTVYFQGAFVGTPDLAYEQARIAIEYEGAHHRTDKNTYEDDIARREQFRRAGWLVLLVTDRMLARPSYVIAEVEALLRERGQPTRAH